MNVVPLKRKQTDNSEAIDCICGETDDDGFSIACDDCSRWCHAACFGIVQGKVPEEWKCWLCRPKRRRANPQPWTHSYVHIEHDIVPNIHTRQKLQQQAQRWRGVTALAPPPTVLRPTPPSIRPPTYAVHTTSPVPSNNLIAPYTSTITPSATYLADPLNAYAHLGMPKPFVHLLGPPLDIALDARLTGNLARFMRSGCKPNAVLRPVLCPPPSDTLSFAVFALRDLKADEEVVLGWEWDDGNAVHALPALIHSPNMFP